MDEIQTKVLKSLLFTVTSTALPWDFFFFKLTQPLTVSTVQLLYTVKEKGGKPDRKPYHLPYGLRNSYKNLESENSQDYAQKPQRNCMFLITVMFKNTPSCSHLHIGGLLRCKIKNFIDTFTEAVFYLVIFSSRAQRNSLLLRRYREKGKGCIVVR